LHSKTNSNSQNSNYPYTAGDNYAKIRGNTEMNLSAGRFSTRKTKLGLNAVKKWDIINNPIQLRSLS